MILIMHSIEHFMIPYILLISTNGTNSPMALTESRKFNKEILGVELENTGSQKERIKEARGEKMGENHLATGSKNSWQVDFYRKHFEKKEPFFLFEDVFFFFLREKTAGIGM